MAGRDEALFVAGTAGAPLNYTVPGAVTFRLKSVYAEFDGTNASGDFLPAVEFVSDSGHLNAIAIDPNSKVAAGGSAAVTWFPGVKSAAAAAGLTNLSTAMGRVDPANPPVILAGSTDTIKWSIVTISGSGLVWTSGLPRQVTVSDGGVIIASVTVAPSLDWPNTVSGVIKISQTYNTSEPLGVQTIYAGHPQIDAFDPSGGSPGQLTSFAFMSNVTQGANPAHWTATIQNTTGSNFTLGQDTSFALTRIAPWINF